MNVIAHILGFVLISSITLGAALAITEASMRVYAWRVTKKINRK